MKMNGKRKLSFGWGAIAVIAVFLLFPFLMPQEKITFTNKDGLLTIAHVRTTAAGGEEDFARSFHAADITDLQLLEEADLGEAAGTVQIDTKNFLAGSRKSGELGEFDLLVYRKVNGYLWIGLADGKPVLMNLASSEMTRSFYEALNKYREEQSDPQENSPQEGAEESEDKT